MDNLADALTREIGRNKELLEAYQGIPTGMFGAAFISADLKEAEAAVANQDVVAMLRAYTKLKENE